MKFERITVYVPDATVSEARAKGLTNVSAFVRKALEDFNTGIATGKNGGKTE